MNVAMKNKTEPTVETGEPVSASPAVGVTIVQPAPPRTTETGRSDNPSGDQLARIEDKLARVEEKFARSEDRMQRLENALEKATGRLEGASNEMNLQGVKDDITAMRRQVAKKPGVASLFLITLITALVAAALGFAAARFGIPGLLPR
jgi:septal ring factor EnvC (AmiA/AmiB activator)